MGIFIRVTGKNGGSSVIEAREGVCLSAFPGARIEMLDVRRDMISVEPFGSRLYVSVFMAGSFELGGLDAAFASDDPPVLVFGDDEGPEGTIASRDDLERLLAEQGPGTSRDESGSQTINPVSVPASFFQDPPDDLSRTVWPQVARAR